MPAAECYAGLTLLAGCWRCDPPPFPLLHGSIRFAFDGLTRTGGGGLLWRIGIRSPQEDAPLFRRARDESRKNAVAAAQHETAIAIAIPRLRAAGIDALVVKGWSLARLYPHPGCRPCGDLDLCVPVGKAIAAISLLADIWSSCEIDIHEGIRDLPDRSWEEIVHHSLSVEVNGVSVHVPSWEDQLRLVALHLCRHGAWRPLWLCDVAVILESLPTTFDWSACLHGDATRTAWLLCAIGLACELLGAIPAVPLPTNISAKAPAWVTDTVLQNWSAGTIGDSHTRVRRPAMALLRRPWAAINGVRERWPNPIEAAFRRGAGPNTRLPSWWHAARMLAGRAARRPFRRAEVGAA